VLVGGTGLYVRAVVDDLRVPGRYPEVAERLAGWSDDELTRRLAELDPVAARRVPAGNRRRLLRALEVTIGSGTPFSASGPGLDHYGPTRFLLAGLAVPREQLGGRVEGRFRRQLEDGLVAEAAALLRRPGGLSRTAAAALGYQELFDHLAGRCTLDEAIASAVRRTRRFAVRQERWFRRDPRIRWFAAPDDPGDAGPGASSERTGTTASRRPADVAEELDRWWSESAVVADGGAATVTSAGAPATDPAGDGPEPTSCD
jgi:tRNA dimethylallyltransferase